MLWVMFHSLGWVNQQEPTLPKSWTQWETMQAFHYSIKLWPSTEKPSTSAGESLLLSAMLQLLPITAWLQTYAWMVQLVTPMPSTVILAEGVTASCKNTVTHSGQCGMTGKGLIGPHCSFQLIIHLVTAKNMERRFWCNQQQKGLLITSKWPTETLKPGINGTKCKGSTQKFRSGHLLKSTGSAGATSGWAL